MAILKDNLRLNSISNVVCHQVAVGGSNGTISISLHPNASVVLENSSGDLVEHVRVVRLDDVVGVETPNFVKLDVEGFEHEALKGSRRILGGSPNLDLELHVSSYRDKSADIRALFEMIQSEHCLLFVQTDVDGPIVPFERQVHTWDALALSEVLHVFCTRKRDVPGT